MDSRKRVFFLGWFVDYVDLQSAPRYKECAPLVEGMGFRLVDLKIARSSKGVKISVVIAARDPADDVSVDGCAKVHHALLARLEALLGTDDVSMELSSPGIDRNIKNAAEFALFKGRSVRVWSREKGDWESGKIVGADTSCVTLEGEGGSVSVPYTDIAKAKFL